MEKYDEVRALPHDSNTELAVLAALIQNPELAAKFSAMLSEDAFYSRHNRDIYKSISGCIAGGMVVDFNAVAEYAAAHCLDVQKADVVDLQKNQSTATLTQDIRRLVSMARRRAVWTAMQEAAAKALDMSEDIDETVCKAVETLTDSTNTTDGIATFAESVDELRSIVRGNARNERAMVETGFPLFDDFFLLRPGTLTVIAAFTSVGKTALALNIAKAAALGGTPVAYYSLEMGKAELAARIIAEDAQISAAAILNKKLDDTVMAAFEAAAARRAFMPLYIDENNAISFEKTIASIRMVASGRRVKMVIIDYLQIYAQNAGNVEASLAEMARSAKNIAMETKCAVVLLSQLNRSDDHPSIKMLRGSGQIEESADNIVLIDRPDAYPDNKVKKFVGDFSDLTDISGMAKLILAKGRGVGTGSRLMRFNGEFTRFTPVYTATEEQPTDNDLPF